jgi:hypothetical protein
VSAKGTTALQIKRTINRSNNMNHNSFLFIDVSIEKKPALGWADALSRIARFCLVSPLDLSSTLMLGRRMGFLKFSSIYIRCLMNNAV